MNFNKKQRKEEDIHTALTSVLVKINCVNAFSSAKCVTKDYIRSTILAQTSVRKEDIGPLLEHDDRVPAELKKVFQESNNKRQVKSVDDSVLLHSNVIQRLKTLLCDNSDSTSLYNRLQCNDTVNETGLECDAKKWIRGLQNSGMLPALEELSLVCLLTDRLSAEELLMLICRLSNVSHVNAKHPTVIRRHIQSLLTSAETLDGIDGIEGTSFSEILRHFQIRLTTAVSGPKARTLPQVLGCVHALENNVKSMSTTLSCPSVSSAAKRQRQQLLQQTGVFQEDNSIYSQWMLMKPTDKKCLSVILSILPNVTNYSLNISPVKSVYKTIDILLHISVRRKSATAVDLILNDKLGVWGLEVKCMNNQITKDLLPSRVLKTVKMEIALTRNAFFVFVNDALCSTFRLRFETQQFFSQGSSSSSLVMDDWCLWSTQLTCSFGNFEVYFNEMEGSMRNKTQTSTLPLAASPQQSDLKCIVCVSQIQNRICQDAELCHHLEYSMTEYLIEECQCGVESISMNVALKTLFIKVSFFPLLCPIFKSQNYIGFLNFVVNKNVESWSMRKWLADC